jgi:hypothetical protein
VDGEDRERRFRTEEPEGLSEKELEEAKGEVLPDREAMSVIRSDVSIPVDPQIAASVLAGDADAPQEEPPKTHAEDEVAEDEEPEDRGPG